jgi:aminoglycoside 3-N-acetyltransferase
MVDSLVEMLGFSGLEHARFGYEYLFAGKILDVVASALSRNLPHNYKRALKAAYGEIKGRAIRLLASYSPLDLEKAFRRLGLSPGDAVMMHSSFNLFTGFQGSPKNVIDCLLNVLGPEGHLFMMSLAYTGSSHDYLLAGNPFDVRLTGSRMGIISEAFRRRKHVLRSANPLHPVLAWGPQARWVVSGHDQLLYSCGPGSPFEKMLELNTKILFFDVGFEYCTFEHYLEDRFKDSSPLPVYKPDLFDVTWFDEEGKKKSMKTYVFEPESSRARNSSVLKKALLQAGFLKQDRIGNTTLMIVSMADALKCAARLVDQGTHFYRG